MELIHQFSSGLFIIQSVIFIVLLLLLKKFAWKPILKALNDREESIADSLNQAKLARKEIEDLKTDNERIIREAKIERDNILKEAREIKDKIVEDAKKAAKVEGDKMIAQAKEAIKSDRAAAMDEIKSQIGLLSVSIAEQILKQKLDSTTAQDSLVEDYLKNSNLN